MFNQNYHLSCWFEIHVAMYSGSQYPLPIQVKKTNKWVCKVCNEKQSVIKVRMRNMVL